MNDTISALLKPETFADGQGPLDATRSIMDMVALGSEPEAIEEPEFTVVNHEPEEEDEKQKGEPAKKEEEPEEESGDDSDAQPGEHAEEDGDEESDDPYSWPESVPTLKAKRGDREFDVPEDAILPVKVDGKLVDVSIADLRRNYSAKIPWEQKYGELKRKEKDIEHREIRSTQEVQKTKGRMVELVQKGKTDPFGAAVDLFLESGAPPEDAVDFVKAYFAQIKVTSQTMQQLTDQQLEARVLQRALDVKDKALQKRAESYETQEKAAREHQELVHYVDRRQKELGISNSEMDEAIAIATDSDVKEFWEMPLQKRADTLMNYVITYLRPRAQTAHVIEKVAPQLSGNQKFHDAILDIVRKENLTPEQTEKTIVSYLRGLAKSSNGHSKNGASIKRETPSEPSTEPQARPKKASKKAEPNAEKTIDPVSMDEVLEQFGIL